MLDGLQRRREGGDRLIRVLLDLPPGWTAPLPDDVEVVGRDVARGEWVEVGDLPALRAAARAGSKLWLRGLEAGGPCGEVGAIVLIRAARASGRPFVVQGLGRRGMAAAVMVGAAGVVLDVHTWLCDGSPLCDAHKAWLAGRSGRDTSVRAGVRTGRTGDLLSDWPVRSDSAVPASQCVGEARPGGLSELVHALRADLTARIGRASRSHPLRSDPFGTGRCVVQGPMANVAERPELGRAVRAAGGLPFCALGALRPEVAAGVLEGMTSLPEPWGAGVIGFDVMPHRDAHLDALDAHRSTPPRPVILAGGSPALAAALVARGHEPWLHTPSARIARMALDRAVPAVVFEGCEAGGHVGALTSAGLWEEGLAVVEAHGSPTLVVLAGGIGDPVSAAFAGAMAADAHAAGHRVALQVGTAFFFTHEIVEAGQITRVYQQIALAAERTVAVGTTVNLPLQCAPNAFTRAGILQEQGWADEGLPLRERRERVEHHNLGRTRLSARGIERDGAGGHRPVPVGRQREEGAFTMGQGATATDTLQTVEELLAGLTDGAARLLEQTPATPSRWGPAIPVSGDPSPRPEPIRARPIEPDAPIAVVGLGAVLPGALDIPAFWELLVHGMDALRPVPDARWRADRYFHPDGVGSQTNVRMAGLVEGFHFDPLRYGIPPRAVPSLDRAQQLALSAAEQAVQGVRIRDRRRAAVVFGNSMGGEHAKSLAVRVRFREVLAALDAEGAFTGLDGDGLAELTTRVEARLDGMLPPVDVEAMSGLLANVIAGRVAAWLDLGGGNLTVDAACAASLAAVAVAMDWLRSGRADVVITGGVDADLAPETYVGFSRTWALSATGSHPFSERADGFVMGEGAAALVLKRLPDALADGDPVWAVLRSVGQSSDGRSTGITAPKVDGQLLAIHRAYAAAGLEPSDVEMIEAHGTGTPLGDRTELQALRRAFGVNPAVIGSVKSQIGHLKGGAGAAGLVKAVLAVAHGLIPPSLHAAPLSSELGGFSVPRGPVPFARAVPRASVSAFGFGGTNYHALVEGHPGGPPGGGLPRPRIQAEVWERPVPQVTAYGASDLDGLIAAFDAGDTLTPEEAAGYPERLVVLDAPAGLRDWLLRGELPDGARVGRFGRSAWRARGPIAPAVLVFPGQGSPREHADAALWRIPAAARVLRELGVDALDTGPGPAAQHHLLVATGSAWAAALSGLDVAGVIGHSVGELSALVGAGRLDPARALALADARGAALHGCPEGGMLAVALDATEAEAFGAPHGLRVAGRNGPRATVLAGSPDAVRAAAQDAANASIRATVLDVRRAFHTPDVAPAGAALASALRDTDLRDGLPWWSNVGGVPAGPQALQALVDAVTAPVGFLESVRAAADAGHRLFVHVGPGASLASHIQAAVSDAVVVSVDPNPSADASGLLPGAAELAALGHPEWLRALPGTLVGRPFPRAPIAPRREIGVDPALQREARRVQDLRIAALADPSLRPTWESARATLLGSLDGLPVPPSVPVPVPVPGVSASTGTGPPPASTVRRPAGAQSTPRSASTSRSASTPPRGAAPDSGTGTGTGRGTGGIREVLISAIGEVTGYPPEAIRPGASLDRDLGIDSIRKMEILGIVQDRLGLDLDGLPELGSLDLDGLIARITALTEAPARGSATTAKAPESSDASRFARWTRIPARNASATLPPDAWPAPDLPLAGLIAPWRTGTPAPVIALDPDLPAHHGLAALLAVRAREGGQPVAVHWRGGLTWTRGLPIDGPPLPDAPVVFASGGATGILPTCLAALPGARGVILGRSGAGTPPAGFELVRCDITDPAAVARAADLCRERFGRIDVVIHAAGLLRDGPLATRTDDDLTAVLDAKIAGVDAMIAATLQDAPAVWAPFSSVAAALANPGQALYAAANATLEAMIHPTAARSTPLVWTAWSGVGMAADPALLRLLRSRGIHPIDPDAGGRLFAEALRGRGRQWLAAEPPPGDDLPWPLTGTDGAGTFRVDLDPNDRVLQDHRVGGRALVPAALWVAALSGAVAVGDPGRARAVSALEVLAPTFVREATHALLRLQPDGRAEILRGDAVVCRARVLPADALSGSAPASLPRAPSGPWYADGMLFHGPAWQMLTSSGIEGARASAEVRLNGTDPLATVVDGAHQLLAAWSGRTTGALGLPVGAAEWAVGPGPLRGPIRVELSARVVDGGVVGQVQAIDADGVLVLTGTDVRLREAGRWSADG